MLLSELIYEARHPGEALQMNHQILAIASIYHDNSRKNANRAFHSRASADNVMQSEYQKTLTVKDVEFLISFHEADHRDLEWHLGQLPVEKQETVRELFQILQDADALDCVRFGYCSENSLDVEQLWLKESRQMTLVSQMLYDGLQKIDMQQLEELQQETELKM